MNDISFQNVEIIDGFWKKKQDMNRDTTIYAVRNRFLETGRFDAFKFEKNGLKKPSNFWDSDIAKWIEGVSYIIAKQPNEELSALVEETIDHIEKNQDENGYFNIYYTVCEPENRFMDRTAHELYCAGHLIEAAVAYYEVTKKDRFLKLMCKYADHIERVFKIDDSANFVTPGHEEIELALVKLYRCTGEKRYLELSKFFVDKRGCNDKDIGKYYHFANAMYDQSHIPVRQQITADGHSVRACYLYSGMADLAKEYNDPELTYACKQLFNNIISKRMYITGGIGQSSTGEAFTIDYDLPNKKAYAETCAAISLAYFAQRMLEIEVDSVYSDIIERVLYNGIMSGISLDGRLFFYENPLEIEPALVNKDITIIKEHRERFPITQRVDVFECSCCPPNLNRFIASVGDYVYGEKDDTYFIHQYMSSRMEHNGSVIIQTTDYPNKGKIKLNVTGIKQLALRIPSFCSSYKIDCEFNLKNGYAYIENPASDIEVLFEMKPTLIQASPFVTENGGRAALQMGPVIYCLEGIDNGDYLKNISVSKDLNAEVIYDDYFGANIIKADGYRPVSGNGLYYPLDGNFEKVRLKFIPYYAFANRGETEMLVWVLV